MLDERRKTGAAGRQPSKSELEEDVRIDVAPEVLAWAVTRGGEERREPDSVG